MAPAPAPAEQAMTRRCALALVALSSLGFALQSLVVKLIVTSSDIAPMEIVFFRGWLQALGCCCVLACHRPVRRHPKRWFGDTLREVKCLAWAAVPLPLDAEYRPRDPPPLAPCG